MVNPQDFGTFNLGNIVAQSEQIRASQARRQQFEQEAQQKRRLGELLPQVMGGGMGEGGAVPGRQAAMQELASIDPDLFMKLDDRQREQAKAEASELVNAVQWADTPEKWAQAQQYLGSKGMDVSGYGFDQREQYLLQAGKIGQLLESRPKPNAGPTSVQEFEYAQRNPAYRDFLEERRGPIVANNGDGTFTLIPRTSGGGGAAPKGPPQPGQVVGGFRFKGGNPNDRNSWEPAGGQTASPSGAFPASGS